jgi:hypothetical protein
MNSIPIHHISLKVVHHLENHSYEPCFQLSNVALESALADCMLLQIIDLSVVGLMQSSLVPDVIVYNWSRSSESILWSTGSTYLGPR